MADPLDRWRDPKTLSSPACNESSVLKPMTAGCYSAFVFPGLSETTDKRQKTLQNTQIIEMAQHSEASWLWNEESGGRISKN